MCHCLLDTNKANDAKEKFVEISTAYEVLGNEDKRKQYDQFGAAAFENGGGGQGGPGGFRGGGGGSGGFQNMDVDDSLRHFGDIFGNQGGGAGASRAQTEMQNRGGDIEINQTLEFMEAAKGVERDLSFRANVKCSPCNGSGSESKSKPQICKTCRGTGQQVVQQGFFAFSTPCGTCGGEGTVVSDPCNSCRGEGVTREKRSLRVKIPGGVDSGSSIRVARQGDAGRRAAASGHLYLNIRVTPHPLFSRKGADIHLQVPVTVSQAVLGGTVQIPTIDEDVELKIPAGTQPNEQRVLRGRGLPQLNDRSTRGHQYVHFNVIVPSKLSEKQRELITEFGQEETLQQQSESKGVFGRLRDFLSKKKD